MRKISWLMGLNVVILVVTSVPVGGDDWGRLAIQCGSAGNKRESQVCIYFNEIMGCAKEGVSKIDLYQCAKSLAEKGNPFATDQLGIWYMQGRVVPQNYAEARNHLLVAAMSRLPSAMRHMMQLESLQDNLVEAYAWALVGAAFEDDKCILARNEIKVILTANEQQDGEKLASALFKILAR